MTWSAQDNTKLFEQLKFRFKRAIDWNKYQPKTSIKTSNKYLDYLIDPSFQRVYRPFALSFENNAHQASYKQFFLPTVEIKDCVVKIGWKNFLISLLKVI